MYGTLIDPFGISAKLNDYVGDNAAQFAQIWRDKQIEYLFRRTLMQDYEDFPTCTRQALEFTNERLQVDLPDAAKDTLMEKYRVLPAYPDVPDALKKLKAASCRMYAFSNGHPDDLEHLLKHARLSEYLDGIVSVHDTMHFKPHPVVYQHFLDTTDSKPEDTWLVSGNPFDIIGAHARDWNSAWLRRDPAAVFDPWDIEPTITVADISELLEVV